MNFLVGAYDGWTSLTAAATPDSLFSQATIRHYHHFYPSP